MELELEKEELQSKSSPIGELPPQGGLWPQEPGSAHCSHSLALPTEPLCCISKEIALWIQELLEGSFHCQIRSACFITMDLCLSF